MKAACTTYAGVLVTNETLLDRAEVFDAWLLKKSGGTASVPDQGEGVGQGEGPTPSSTTEGKWTERVKDWPTDA